MNRDTVIGIVGAFILVAAMVGVFQYERTRAGAVLGPNDWSLQNATMPDVSGETIVGASTEAVVNVTQQNATRLTFTLTWTPSSTPAGANTDVVRLTLTAPEGFAVPADALTAEDSSGTITIEIPVLNAKPTAGNPGLLATGEWPAVVEFVSTDDPTSPLPLPATQTVSWTLTTTVMAWMPAESA